MGLCCLIMKVDDSVMVEGDNLGSEVQSHASAAVSISMSRNDQKPSFSQQKNGALQTENVSNLFSCCLLCV